MDIGIVGGGINGLCSAWVLAEKGHRVSLYERGRLMGATSSASSKLLHGGLRYLENGEFRLVSEALRERDAWLRRVPELARPIRLVLPLYRHARRPGWMVGGGLFLYNHLAGKSLLPKAAYRTAREMVRSDSRLTATGLVGGYEFSDGQMDDYGLGEWVARQCALCGVEVHEQTEIVSVAPDGTLTTAEGRMVHHERVINVAGPWAEQLLRRSGLSCPYRLDLVRGSHLVLAEPCPVAYLLEVPGERRVFFVLPWKGSTLLGTTEVRQGIDEEIICSSEERNYLLNAYRSYFPDADPVVVDAFAGLRPLLQSARDPGKATREYALHRTGNLITVLGGKWTTAMALAEKVTNEVP